MMFNDSEQTMHPATENLFNHVNKINHRFTQDKRQLRSNLLNLTTNVYRHPPNEVLQYHKPWQRSSNNQTNQKSHQGNDCQSDLLFENMEKENRITFSNGSWISDESGTLSSMKSDLQPEKTFLSLTMQKPFEYKFQFSDLKTKDRIYLPNVFVKNTSYPKYTVNNRTNKMPQNEPNIQRINSFSENDFKLPPITDSKRNYCKKYFGGEENRIDDRLYLISIKRAKNKDQLQIKNQKNQAKMERAPNYEHSTKAKQENLQINAKIIHSSKSPKLHRVNWRHRYINTIDPQKQQKTLAEMIKQAKLIMEQNERCKEVSMYQSSQGGFHITGHARNYPQVKVWITII